MKTMNVQDNIQHQNMKITSKKVWKVIHFNCHLTIHEVAEEDGISKIHVSYEILTENLSMHGVAAKFVLHLLSEDQKQNCVDVSQELVKQANADEKF